MAALKVQVDAKDAELKLAQAEARQAAQEAVGLTKDLAECQGFAKTSLQAVEEAEQATADAKADLVSASTLYTPLEPCRR